MMPLLFRSAGGGASSPPGQTEHATAALLSAGFPAFGPLLPLVLLLLLLPPVSWGLLLRLGDGGAEVLTPLPGACQLRGSTDKHRVLPPRTERPGGSCPQRRYMAWCPRGRLSLCLGQEDGYRVRGKQKG